MGVLFEVLDDLFADHLALKATQCGLDRFVRIHCNKSHFVFSPPFGQIFRPKGKQRLHTISPLNATLGTAFDCWLRAPVISEILSLTARMYPLLTSTQYR